MRARDMLGILSAAAVVGICICSPLFLPNIQDDRIIGTIQVLERITEAEESVSLIEKIRIYSEYENREFENEERPEAGNLEEMRNETGEIYTIFSETVQELQSVGIISQEINMQMFEKYTMQIYTCTNEAGEYVTVWKINLTGQKEGISFVFEPDTEKIIAMTLTGQEQYPGSGKDEDELVKAWGKYLGLVGENVGENEYEYSEGNERQLYAISKSENGISIQPYVQAREADIK